MCQQLKRRRPAEGDQMVPPLKINKVKNIRADMGQGITIKGLNVD